MNQQAENNCRVKVPAVEGESKVLDVKIKHILVGFGIVFTGIAITSTGIVLLKEHSRYSRQKALLDSALQLTEILFRKEPDVQK